MGHGQEGRVRHRTDHEVRRLGAPWRYAGEVKDFDPSAFLTRKETLRYDPFIQYAVAAATMAAEDARLLIPGQHTNISPLSSGVVIGSSRGGIMTIERESKKLYSGSPSRLSPYVMPASTIGMAASVVAQKLGIRGACLGISNACASGSIAVGEACHLVRHGCARIVIAGGRRRLSAGSASRGTDVQAPCQRSRALGQAGPSIKTGTALCCPKARPFS
ncbi:MAG: hypothetical protein MZV70_34665 [Desulfobacterales bacterium]|nr:hypothetical protein [Desulfobacterales bacterium]